MSATPVSLLKFLVWLACVECLLIAMIIAVSIYANAYLAACIPIASVLGVAAIARAAFVLIYNRQLAAFPAQPIQPDAEQRSFQSFSVGCVNMGLSLHAA
ncbi:MAG: hypothetical protein ABGZ35_22540, partial [Planctomycetaceae bacterium]